MTCLRGANILLPEKRTEQGKWAVIACDQFTSQPEYWREAEKIVGDSPSMLKMIYPEVYLNLDDEEEHRARVERIQRTMEEYLAGGILEERVRDGYVLTERITKAGIRVGLVAALDLDTYDYSPGTKAAVRATEQTVAERIPVRVGIRKGARLESPHVMMLLDDSAEEVLNHIYKKREQFEKLYDTELMLGGGHLRGYGIEGAEAEKLTEKLKEMEAHSGEIFLAVGDGNHSLAAAKACWEEKKKGMSAEEQENHPARYALVEVVDLYSESLNFEPIHRIVYGAEKDALTEGFVSYLAKAGAQLESCAKEDADVCMVQSGEEKPWKILGTDERIPVDFLQKYLDEYLRENPEMSIDYIHSPETVRQLSEGKDGSAACGILLRCIDKKELFPAVRAGGVLPRKTFSIGEEVQKRYYMECRKLF